MELELYVSAADLKGLLTDDVVHLLITTELELVGDKSNFIAKATAYDIGGNQKAYQLKLCPTPCHTKPPPPPTSVLDCLNTSKSLFETIN